MIDSEAPLHVCKATEPPAVKIREINLRSCRRQSNPRRQHDERASYPLGHRGSARRSLRPLVARKIVTFQPNSPFPPPPPENPGSAHGKHVSYWLLSRSVFFSSD